MKRIGPWKRLSRREVFRNSWIRVQADEVLRPDGGKGGYGMVQFANYAIGIVAVDAKGRIPLVGQHRYPLDYYSWELPEGGCRKGSDSPRRAAARELREETGLKARQWNYLGCLTLSNSVCDEVAHLFLARGLIRGEPEPDPTEKLQVKWISLEAACRRVLEGTITESITMAGVLRARDFLAREKRGQPPVRYRRKP